jgi:tRNA threonylcarbamoyladenosine biosynthesis protein TsaB
VLILAIDTCDAHGSVALAQDGVVLSSLPHDSGEDYSTWLLPAVDHVLNAACRRLVDVELYAAAAGPGSFTGIRVALTTVKAWNEVFHKPIAAVSRLEAFAVQAADAKPGLPKIVAAFCDGGRGQLYGAVYCRAGDRYEPVGDERVVTAGELIWWASDVAGNDPVGWASPDPSILLGDPAWQERGARGEVPEEVPRQVPRVAAPAIAKIAVQLAAHGRLTDALRLDANYIRRPDAEVKWKGYTKPLV